MTSGVAAALALSLVSAVALNWGFLAEHRAASTLPPLTMRHPLRSLWVLLGNRLWLAGSVSGLAGWALYIYALTLAPLSLVQAASAGGIAVLALLVHVGGSERLTGVEWGGVALAVVGVAVLALSAGGVHSHRASAVALGLWFGVSAAAAGLAAGPGARLVAGGAGLGIASGIAYGAGDVATKAATLGAWWAIPLVAAGSVCGFAALQLGFQRGAALATAGVSSVLTNALPIAAGVAVFGEAVSILRGVAFALLVAGAALLVRAQGLVEPEPSPKRVIPAPDLS